MHLRDGGAVSVSDEAVLLHDILQALGAMDGVVVWRNNVGIARHGNARVAYGVGGEGAPDLLCEVRATDGFWRVLWIEVKTPTGAIAKHQTEWHATARSQGRETVIARSVQDATEAVKLVRVGWRTYYDRGRAMARCKGE